MATNKCKCPECGATVKTKGTKTFRHCGSSWNINENLVGVMTMEESDLEEEENLGDEVGYTLPTRSKQRKVIKEKKDELICPFCNGDVYATERKGVYYCARCQKYLIEE
jgi:ribosomal protein L37AE/L43A